MFIFASYQTKLCCCETVMSPQKSNCDVKLWFFQIVTLENHSFIVYLCNSNCNTAEQCTKIRQPISDRHFPFLPHYHHTLITKFDWVQIHYWCTALMWMIVKMSIADWLPYPPPLCINIGFGLRANNSIASCTVQDKNSISMCWIFIEIKIGSNGIIH